MSNEARNSNGVRARQFSGVQKKPRKPAAPKVGKGDGKLAAPAASAEAKPAAAPRHASFAQGAGERLPIRVIVENRFAPVPRFITG